jgi:hypothetical protein
MAVAGRDGKSLLEVLATVVVPIQIVGGVLVYALVSLAHVQFYGALEVAPADVGLGYAATLASVIGLEFFVFFGAFVVAIFLINYQMSRKTAWYALAVIHGLLFVAFLAFVIYNSTPAANAVKQGRPVVPIRTGPLLLLAIHADPATIKATGKPGETKAVDDLAKRDLLYLGSTGGTAVFYDSRNHRAVYVPRSNITLEVSNCRIKPPADSRCARTWNKQ